MDELNVFSNVVTVGMNIFLFITYFDYLYSLPSPLTSLSSIFLHRLTSSVFV